MPQLSLSSVEPDPNHWRATGPHSWMPIKPIPVVLCLAKAEHKNRNYDVIPATWTLVNKNTGEVIIRAGDWGHVVTAANEWAVRQ